MVRMRRLRSISWKMNESLKRLLSAAGDPGLRCETGWNTRFQSGDECVSKSLVLCGRGQVVDRENGEAMLARTN